MLQAQRHQQWPFSVCWQSHKIIIIIKKLRKRNFSTLIDKGSVGDLSGCHRVPLNGGSPIQRVEEDKKGSNEVVLRVNRSEGCYSEIEKERPRRWGVTEQKYEAPNRLHSLMCVCTRPAQALAYLILSSSLFFFFYLYQSIFSPQSHLFPSVPSATLSLPLNSPTISSSILSYFKHLRRCFNFYYFN